MFLSIPLLTETFEQVIQKQTDMMDWVTDKVDEKVSTVISKNEMINYMNQQLDYLDESMVSNKNELLKFQNSLQDSVKDMARQAGSMREQFTSAINEEIEKLRNRTFVLMMISLIPTTFLVIWEIIRATCIRA